VIAYRRLAKGRLVIGSASVLVGILPKGSSLLVLGNYVSAVGAPAAKGVVPVTAANEKPVGSTGATGATGPQGVSGLSYRGHFSTSGGLPTYDGATVIKSDWATVGSNNEVWQVDSGIWVDQGYNIPGMPRNPEPSGIFAITGTSFAIPSVGSAVWAERF
jgi:hypothetical protein